MVEYKHMVSTLKQKIAQKVLDQHSTFKHGLITLMYAPTTLTEKPLKPCIIVSISKKTAPKAVARNYIKRVLRALLRQTLKKEVLKAYNWMWICKMPEISKEARAYFQAQLLTITV